MKLATLRLEAFFFIKTSFGRNNCLLLYLSLVFFVTFGEQIVAAKFFNLVVKMLNNQVAVEAIYSATYLENYLDSVENLPNDLQRHISRMRQLDVDFQGNLTDFFGV